MTNGESAKDMTNKFAKLDKFEGQDFRRWQKKMHFLLTTLKVVYVTPMPEVIKNETIEQTRKRCKWENDDYIYHGHILNGISDSLFDVYQNVDSAKELWDSLESKYMAEDASSKKFLMDESISVYGVIDKLLPSWKDFKHTLKHNKDDMTLVELGSHFRIEEALRTQEIENNPKGKNQVSDSSVNIVEDGGPSKKSKDDKGDKQKFKGNYNSSNKNPKMACWKCSKPGHFKKDYRVGKGKQEKQNAGPSGSKDPEKQQDQMLIQNYNSCQNYVSLISEAFYVQDDNIAWWIDSGATSHVCKDLRWFIDFQPIEDGSILKMGNVATEPIKGVGYVKLVFTSGKCILLNNVLYVLGIRKNLLSGVVLNNHGYKQVYESDKYILSKHGNFVGFGYLCNESNDYVSVNSIIESRDAIFDENRFTSMPRPRDMLQNSYSKNSVSTEDVHGPSEPRRNTRARKVKSFGDDFHLYLVEDPRDEIEYQYQYYFIIEDDPKTFCEVMTSRDVTFWKEAIQDEMVSIMNNNTWELSDLPPGCKALGSRWIFKRKMKVDALVVIHNLVIHQMDVKTAFLNGELDEEIYMKQPEGFVMPGYENKVCKLKKSLYGLKQAPKDWHDKFDNVVLSNGYC
ncbi:uncharacterized protein LOC141714511 [Apium graveolens]|uniref:uncharacterized protein LOC141714511 n=1 Tax=Apium graveolens TaxID=4045 RepID=UPI003D7B84A2